MFKAQSNGLRNLKAAEKDGEFLGKHIMEHRRICEGIKVVGNIL